MKKYVIKFTNIGIRLLHDARVKAALALSTAQIKKNEAWAGHEAAWANIARGKS